MVAMLALLCEYPKNITTGISLCFFHQSLELRCTERHKAKVTPTLLSTLFKQEQRRCLQMLT